MSSYETRRNRSGDVSHRIRFRYRGSNKSVTFASEKAARDWKDLLDRIGPRRALEVLDDDRPEQSAPTVAQLVAGHIDHLTGVTEGTRKRYRGYLERRIDPDPLGRVPADLLTRDDVAAWVNRLAKDLSAKTIKNHHSLLSDTLTAAVTAGTLPVNVARGVRIAAPDDTPDEMTTLDEREVFEFIAAAPDHWRPLITFLFGVGCRFGEATALQVRDVDLARGTARITRAWKDTGGQGHKLGRPKSERSRRTVVFGRAVAEAIAPLMADRRPDAWLFTNTRGGPVRRTNFAEQGWAPTVHEFAGDTARTVQGARGRPRVEWQPGPGKRPTPHDARHTYASLQIKRGRSMAFVQRQLGHESIDTTNSVYSHFQTEDLRVLADVIDQPLELEAP